MADATIIMAGGSGTRLWPASIPSAPKQLMRIGSAGADGRPPSLVQQAVLRALAATPEGPIVVVTHRDHVEPIAEHVRELATPDLLSRVVYLPEPVGRNTAPAIALGVRWIAQEHPPDASVLVLTADHVIEPVDRFAADAGLAVQLAGEGYLVTFGIAPTRPETGYGYIQAGAGLATGLVVDAFREKPDRETAEEYLRRGNFYWNAGMFAFTAGRFADELAEHAPEIARVFGRSGRIGLESRSDGSRAADPDALASVYESLPKASIDYALLEKSERVAVVPASFAWSDVGSWDEAAGLSPSPDRATAPGAASIVEIESSGNHIDSDLPVALCGVNDLHVVVKNGRVLVCRRGESQLVKEAVETAKAAGMGDLVGE
jgi:mannose-1-phosphate guanylyltransferase/mannose-6-phosphate isomerase